MVGALRMELPDGRRFSLGNGLTDALRRNAPPAGTLITYRYRELIPIRDRKSNNNAMILMGGRSWRERQVGPIN